jgi:hypothetical protein
MLSSVAGVELEPKPIMAYPAARALRNWLTDVALPAFEGDGAPLVGLDIAAAYVCRNVNYADDGELSEHARGRAIDISGFRRADGSSVSVLDGWRSREHGDLLREVHEGACGIFSTSIGPGQRRPPRRPLPLRLGRAAATLLPAGEGRKLTFAAGAALRPSRPQAMDQGGGLVMCQARSRPRNCYPHAVLAVPTLARR